MILGPPTARARHSRFNGVMKVLVVDGSRDSRRDTVDALAQLTNVIILGAVANVRTALHALADAPADVVVTGAVLPDGDGAQLVERVRRLTRAPSIVVVADAPTEEQRNRYLAAGADRFVDRGAGMQELQDALLGLGRGRGSVISEMDTLRLLGRMTAGTVHDLNNYLAAAEGCVALLTRHPDDPSLWTQLRAALGAMARINGTLLGYARGVTPSPSSIDLGSVVRETLAVCGRLIPSNVRLTMDIMEGLRPVRGVASELEQLVLNLVINACDAMPDGGALHVAVTRTAAAAVLLRVADSGSGLDTRSRDRGGLGLSIVHAVVERHAGAVQFASRPGGGTVVDVVLPA
jgi:signal transduction histidine kinase